MLMPPGRDSAKGRSRFHPGSVPVFYQLLSMASDSVLRPCVVDAVAPQGLRGFEPLRHFHLQGISVLLTLGLGLGCSHDLVVTSPV